MKYKALFVIVGLVFFLRAEDPQISFARANFENIQKAHLKIETMLKWHTFYQITTAACLVAGVGGAVYAVYNATRPKDTIAPEKVFGQVDLVELRDSIIKLTMYAEKLLSDTAVKRNWIMSPLHWLKQTALTQFQSILVGVSASMLFNVMNNALGPISKYITRLDGFADRTFSGIYHKNSLEWFITHQANLTGVSTTLKQYAALIEGRELTVASSGLGPEQIIVGPVSEAKRLEDLHDFAGYWMIFIQQLESVLGFMQYKSLLNSNPAVTERMVAITTKIQCLVNNFADSLCDKVIQSENGAIVFYDELVALTGQIGFEFSNFTLLDSFKRIDVMNETSTK